MSTIVITMEETSPAQKFLDGNQYTNNSIRNYEILFGKTFVSTGGEAVTAAFVKSLQLQKGNRVLDVGCGVGGNAFYMATKYQAKVVGVDLSLNMISQGRRYLSDQDDVVKQNVELQHGDINEFNFEENSFDCIFTRETMIYIQDKERLFANFLKWLKPEGKLLISEYCRGSSEAPTTDFLNYVKNRSYHMPTVREYGEILTKVGFEEVFAEDKTLQCIDILQEDLNRMLRQKTTILNSITRLEYDDIQSAWEMKQKRCKTKDQSWGLFTAKKRRLS